MAARPPIAMNRSTVQTIACQLEEVVLGVDTHLKTHTAVLVDLVGRQVDAETFPTTKRGNQALLVAGIEVFEVTRPKRRKARHRGKNDTRDALAAAQSVLADADEPPGAEDARRDRRSDPRAAHRPHERGQVAHPDDPATAQPPAHRP